MHDLGRWEAVEMRAARSRVGADVLAIDVVAGVQVRQLLGFGGALTTRISTPQGSANASSTPFRGARDPDPGTVFFPLKRA